MIAVSTTSVFLKVIPMAKLRCANSATTQSVASSCPAPPISAAVQKVPDIGGSACPVTAR